MTKEQNIISERRRVIVYCVEQAIMFCVMCGGFAAVLLVFSFLLRTFGCE